jgi:hypothetical protein
LGSGEVPTQKVVTSKDGSSEPAQSDWPPIANGLTEWIDRHRHGLLVASVAVVVLAFNGYWRIGSDSAVYRQLGHNLVEGRGYTYHGAAEEAFYPGLPWMLAACERLTGRSAVLPLMLMTSMSFGVLVLVYRTLLIDHPRWLAVTATFLTAFSGTFVLHSAEILSDMPFLCFLMLALFALESWRVREESDGYPLKSISLLVLGLGGCLVTRPTVWFFLMALMLVATRSIIPRKRRETFVVLGMLLVMVSLWSVLDPRRGTVLLGSYSGWLNAIWHRLTHVDELWVNVIRLFEDALPRAMFGYELGPGINTVACALAIGGVVGLLRRRPVWAMMALGLMMFTAFAGSVPRYFLMIQPILVVAWLYVFHRIAEIFPQKAGWILGFGIALFFATNMVRSASVVWEQRGIPFAGQSFYERYDHGQWNDVVAFSDVVRGHLPHETKIIGQQGGPLTYLLDCRVSFPIVPFHDHYRLNWGKTMAASNYDAIILPMELYRESLPPLFELVESNVIQTTKTNLRSGRLRLAWIEVDPEKWKFGRKEPFEVWRFGSGFWIRPNDKSRSAQRDNVQ